MENAALGKHNNFHTSYNLFFQQNTCFKMLALFPLPSHYNWWLYVQLLASMFSFRRNATLSNKCHFSFLSPSACFAWWFPFSRIWLSITGSWMLSPSYVENHKEEFLCFEEQWWILIVIISCFFPIFQRLPLKKQVHWLRDTYGTVLSRRAAIPLSQLLRWHLFPFSLGRK